MATKHSLAEQVLLKIYGRPSKPSDPIQAPDVILAVGQMANMLLKAQYYETMNTGERVMNSLVIAEYPKQPLKSYGGRKSICKLPAMPVNLPRNQGVWLVATDEYFSCIGIPMGSGQSDLLKSVDVISGLMGQWGFEVSGMNVITTKDLTIDGTDGLYFRLIVSDIATLGDYDPMPLTADMEAQLVQQVYQSFVPPPPVDRTVDNYSSNPQPAKV